MILTGIKKRCNMPPLNIYPKRVGEDLGTALVGVFGESDEELSPGEENIRPL